MSFIQKATLYISIFLFPTLLVGDDIMIYNVQIDNNPFIIKLEIYPEPHSARRFVLPIWSLYSTVGSILLYTLRDVRLDLPRMILTARLIGQDIHSELSFQIISYDCYRR